MTGFISAEDETEKRPKPVPLEQVEVDRIMRRMESNTPRVRIGFDRGDAVRIKDGPFADFMGTVDDVNEERGKMQVLVSFFGRETPVELDFLQVEKGLAQRHSATCIRYRPGGIQHILPIARITFSKERR